jgi:hypothetical protein
MINLITSFFNKNIEEYTKRNEEYNNALINNLKCEYIEKIHLFIEDEYSEKILDNIINQENAKNKVVKINFNKQPLYSDFFQYANTNLIDKIIMVSNSDIYLNNCDNGLIQDYIENKNNIFCLTRFEDEINKPLIDDYGGSHDSFIYKSPINTNIIENSNFKQNVWGSENLIIWLFYKNHYNLLNPCYQIKIIHLHKTELRNNDRRRINNTEFMHDYKTIGVGPINL